MSHALYTTGLTSLVSLWTLFSATRSLSLSQATAPSSLLPLDSLLCLPPLLPLYGRADSSTTRVFSSARLTWIMPESGGAGILRETAFSPKRTSNCSTSGRMPAEGSASRRCGTEGRGATATSLCRSYDWTGQRGMRTCTHVSRKNWRRVSWTVHREPQTQPQPGQWQERQEQPQPCI